MEDGYIKEKYYNEMTAEDEKREILRNIINTKAELTNANINFEFANTKELIDYYIYKIKSKQSELDNLIKLSKYADMFGIKEEVMNFVGMMYE